MKTVHSEMDANKEESDRCIEIAQKYLHEGNHTKALKFLHKAQKLCPSSKKIKDLLNRCENNDEGEPTKNGFSNNEGDYSAFDQYESNVRSRFRNSKSQPDFTKQSSNASSESTSDGSASSKVSDDGPNHRNRSKSRTRNSSTSSTGGGGGCHRTPSSPQLGVDYSDEQIEAVQRIRRCKDYYEILNVKKDFNEGDLKKQYKKLALQFHPDKNRAPGATEAFKAIGNAYAVLSDPKKRERYDIYGTETTPSTSRRRNNFYEYDYTRGFEADMTAEEIFNMFFGGGFSQDVYRRRHANFRHHFHQFPADGEQRNESAAGVLLQLMPILILVALSVFSQFLVPDAAFSLHRTEKYAQERRTGELGVVYYVKPDFVKQYSGNIYRVEQQVEEEYVQQLRANCFRERSHRETAMWRARNYGDADLYEKAQALRTPSCDRLAEIYT